VSRSPRHRADGDPDLAPTLNSGGARIRAALRSGTDMLSSVAGGDLDGASESPGRRGRGGLNPTWIRDRGASAVEYGLLVAGIAAVIAVAVFALGPVVRDAFQTGCDNIAAGMKTTCPAPTAPATTQTPLPPPPPEPLAPVGAQLAAGQ
jgi:pilus assembly protein Flp/PilA